MNSLRAPHKLTPAPARYRLLRAETAALLLASAGLWHAVPARAQKALPAPVTIGATPPAEKPELAPVEVKGNAPAPSELAPVVIGASGPSGKTALSPVQIGGVAAVGGAGLAVVNASALRVPLLLKSVEAGTAKVEELLQAGTLTPDDLKWAVHHPQLWQQSAPVRTATPSTIEVYSAYLARFDEEVVDAVNWEPPAREALARELSRRGDARCVPLFETMTVQWIADWERGDRRKIEGSVPGLHALAWFYQDKNEQLKAAQTYEKSVLYSTAPSWVSSALIESAQIYARLGEADKSAALYAQVTPYNDGWASMLVLYAEAMPLINAGKLDEAKAVLSRPVTMKERAADGNIAQNAWLASLSYQQGDLESALRYGEQMKQAATGQKLTKATTQNLYQMGLEVYNRAGGWKNQPIQTDTQEVVFQSNPSQPDRPLYARFRVKTYGDRSITASVDNPNIQARVLPVNNWQREGMNAQEAEMEVIVQTNSSHKFNDVPLVLSSATRGKTTTVRLSLGEKSA